MEKKTKALIILVALTIIFTIIGGTLAYFQWTSSNEQKTNVTFTVASGFSCSADGGGSLTSNDVQLAPAACTNTTYAIKRTITVHPTITQANKTIYLDMWLKVNSISSNLSASQNFKYALTTSSSNCTTDIVEEGNFNGATTNTQKTLLDDKEYSQTTTETYYLWVWLDSAETSSNTMNQSFNIELGGNCTDESPYVYTANLYVKASSLPEAQHAQELSNSVWIGYAIPNNIDKYYDPNGPTQAMTALETAYSAANNGAVAVLPFFLKHKIGDGALWCAYGTQGHSFLLGLFCPYQTEAECNSKKATEFEISSDYGTYTCQENAFTDSVSESYIGFVVTPAMATNNPGMTAGTYYLRGGDSEKSYTENINVLQTAFGENSEYCSGGSSSIYCQYLKDYDENEDEYLTLSIEVSSHGWVSVTDDATGSFCNVGFDSSGSNCSVNSD